MLHTFRRSRTSSFFKSCLVLFSFGASFVAGHQQTMTILAETQTPSESWKLELSKDWDCLGPFPIHAREQHYLSPAYPLELSAPYTHEQNKAWPSSYADGGFVQWTKAQSDSDGNLNVSFPNIRWSYLRATEGWNALQYHSILHTTFNITPKTAGSLIQGPRLNIQLQQGSFFMVVPRRDIPNFTPEWYAGNIYGLKHTSNASVQLPISINRYERATFDLFVSGDYEIRLFGDPRDEGSEIPTLKLNIQASLEDIGIPKVARQDTHDVVCDFVDGLAFGDAIGVGIRSVSDWWTVQAVQSSNKSIAASLKRRTKIAPGQTRVVPIHITQSSPIEGDTLSLTISLARQGYFVTSMPVSVKIRNLSLWNTTSYRAIHASYFFAASHPSYFVVIPPVEVQETRSSNPILALHGAGVDVDMPFWADAFPRQQHSWIIMPTGRTEWGLDWHLVSAKDAWSSLAALSSILNRHWPMWTFNPDAKVILAGHSNGGQGVWHLAVHYPDRVRAAIAAAGFMNAQAYVSTSLSHGGRFVDPMLRAVLESAYISDNNELFLGNIDHNIPILAMHGGNDTNVPAWHTREYFSTLLSWNEAAEVQYIEDNGQPHWYSQIFSRNVVQSFINKTLEGPKSVTPEDFTLVVHAPALFETLHGWSIDSVLVPGRLARLHVSIRDKTAYVQTSNVYAFSMNGQSNVFDSLVINGMPVPESDLISEDVRKRFVLFGSTFSKTQSQASVPPGRVQNIFDTAAPLAIIIPADPAIQGRYLYAARRIAHSVDTYLKLDSEIVLDTAALDLLNKGEDIETFRGNLIVLGGHENTLSRHLLGPGNARRESEFSLNEAGKWSLRGLSFDNLREESLGLIFTHPHPLYHSGLAIFIAGTDQEGFERALRLFPIRTGIAVPDWVIIGKDAERRGMGGVVGAGLWDSSWRWSETMSYLLT